MTEEVLRVPESWGDLADDPQKHPHGMLAGALAAAEAARGSDRDKPGASDCRPRPLSNRTLGQEPEHSIDFSRQRSPVSGSHCRRR